MDLKKSLEDLKKNLDLKSLDEQLKKQLAWLQQRYRPAKLLTVVGVIVIAAGIIGTGVSLAFLAELFVTYSPWQLLSVSKLRFELMASLLRFALFVWIFVTGFGIVTRRRWAGVSAIIGYMLVQSQSVYVVKQDYFNPYVLSLSLSLAAFFVCFVIQFHWEVLMVNVDEQFPKECDHDALEERSKGFTYWGFYTFCPGCHKRVYFWDNIFATPILLAFSLGWATWWYWPIYLWPLVIG